MIRTIAKAIFQPLNNRHYVGKKTHATFYFVEYLPLIILLVIAEIVEPSKIWIWIGIVAILIGLVDYFIFDRWLDKFMWDKVYKRFYPEQPGLDLELQQAMKDLQRDPTEANRQRVGHLISNQKGVEK